MVGEMAKEMMRCALMPFRFLLSCLAIAHCYLRRPRRQCQTDQHTILAHDWRLRRQQLRPASVPSLLQASVK